LEHAVHYSLLVGLVLSGLLLAGGLAAAWLSPAPARPIQPQALLKTVDDALGGNAGALMNLGILTLMATPIVRVIILACGWLTDRQWRMAAVALAVLVLLGVSLLLGLG
jgi:uncharacterized membrane protein